MGSKRKKGLLLGKPDSEPILLKKKWKPQAREDRISKLPDKVLCHMLSFLPTKYAVMTSSLSTRWKDIWASVPILDFNNQLSPIEKLYLKKRNESKYVGFFKFVDRVLSLRASSDSGIKRFCLDCICDSEDFSRIEGWIQFAIRHNVAELDLCVGEYPDLDPFSQKNLEDLSGETNSEDQTFVLPQCIFMCKTLVVLKLKSKCIIPTPTSGCCVSLKILHITLEYLDNESVGKFFTCCPVLEDLTIDGYLGLNDVLNFKLSAPELKRLRLIFSHSSCIEDHDHEYSFLINCPKLESLDLKQDILSNYVFENEKSLVKATLDLFSHDVAELQPNRAAALLAGISNVKYLYLSTHLFQTVMKASVVPAFHNLNELKLVLHACYNLELLIECLKISPNLEYLVLEYSRDEECTCSDDEECSDNEERSKDKKWNTPEFVPICLLSHLKTITIRGFQGYLHEMEMAKYLLENAEVLHEMTIYLADFLDKKEEIYKEFSTFRRGSRTCRVEFIEGVRLGDYDE